MKEDDAYIVVDETNGIVVASQAASENPTDIEAIALRYRQVHGHRVGIYAKVASITDEHMAIAAQRAADEALAAHEAERKRIADWTDEEAKRKLAADIAAGVTIPEQPAPVPTKRGKLESPSK